MFCLYTLDGTPDSDVARQALLKCTSAFVESSIEPFALARRLFEEEIIYEDVYKLVRDKKTGAKDEERLDLIFENVKDHVKLNGSAFMNFLDILRDGRLNRQDLANKIMAKYKGIMNFNAYVFTNSYLFQN